MRPGGRFADWQPTPIRYIVADIDGTLVGPTAHATDGVVAAVARARDAGIAVGFATGRMRLAAETLWEQLRPTGPHVLHNGAEVRADGASLASWPLAAEAVARLVDICGREGHYAEFYVPDGYHVTDLRDAARPHWELLGSPPAGLAADLPTGVPVLKATFGIFDGDSQRIEDLVESLGLRPGAASSPLTPDITYVNATSPAVHKGEALRVAANHVGVTLEQTAAIGDGRNDLPMFALVGTAIAMGDASDEVKAAAHLITADVDDDGVAVALDALLTLGS